jgi:hypothetical protein
VVNHLRSSKKKGREREREGGGGRMKKRKKITSGLRCSSVEEDLLSI